MLHALEPLLYTVLDSVIGRVGFWDGGKAIEEEVVVVGLRGVVVQCGLRGLFGGDFVEFFDMDTFECSPLGLIVQVVAESSLILGPCFVIRGRGEETWDAIFAEDGVLAV